MLIFQDTRCLLFGAGGRIGSLCATLLRERSIPYGTLSRHGDLTFDGKHLGNVHSSDPQHGRYFVIDASVDYASLEQMVDHERAKQAFIHALDARRELAGFVAFSSGAVEFDDADITTEWHRRYKRIKLDLEALIEGLDCPTYCPRIFTLMGPRSFRVATSGWVNVMQQVCSGAKIGIGAPRELRSWLAEDFLWAELIKFFESPGKPLSATPVNGTFCLREVAEFTAAHIGRSIVIESRCVGSWLRVPYVSRESAAPGYTLAHVLTPVIRAHMASLEALTA